MKPGKEYELLIEQMYRELEPNAIITHDDHIYDERAKIKRQIDVSIRYQFAGVENLIIVQAKDYKIKANIEVVDQFQQVIEDVNANKGILICTKGFSAAALNKAKSYGIECLSVHSALKKNWETLVKIRVKRDIHYFDMEQEFWLNVAHKAGQKVTLLEDTFSYDGENVISVGEVIVDHIINKNIWRDVKKGRFLCLNFKDIELYHSFDDEMLPVIDGFIRIKYERTESASFFITPTNYLYETNHIKGESKLHNLVITEEILDNIIKNDFINDYQAIGNENISLRILKFKNGLYSAVFSFNTRGGIEGDFFVKNGTLLKRDERGEKIVELENILKKSSQSFGVKK